MTASSWQTIAVTFTGRTSISSSALERTARGRSFERATARDRTSPSTPSATLRLTTASERRLDERPIQFADRVTAEELHRARDVVAENFDRSRDTCRAGGAEAVGVGAADQDGARADAERFHHVAA